MLAAAVLLSSASSLLQSAPHTRVGRLPGLTTRRAVQCLAASGPQSVVVVGDAGGAARALACRFAQDPDCRVRAVLHDLDEAAREALPASVSVRAVPGSSKEMDGEARKIVAEEVRKAGGVVIAAPDDGTTGAPVASAGFLSALADGLSGARGVRQVICVDNKAGSADSGGSFLSNLPVIGGGAAGDWSRVQAASSAPCVSLRCGRLFGGVPGTEPMAFLSGPQRRPELDEHYAARAVVLSRSEGLLSVKASMDPGAVQARTSRLMLAETAYRIAAETAGGRRFAPTITVVSLDGKEPAEPQWSQLLDRVDEDMGIELFQTTFAEVPDPQRLRNWLAREWAPVALSSISTYTKRYGARPVSTRETEMGLAIRWEDATKDFQVYTAGEVLVDLDEAPGPPGSPPRLRMTRADARGQKLSTPLPGEDEIIQRLAEGIEQTVFKKKYALRDAPEAVAKEETTAVPETAPVSATAAAGKEDQSQQAPSSKEGETRVEPAASKAPRRKRRSNI